jgi:hypothetical protein
LQGSEDLVGLVQARWSSVNKGENLLAAAAWSLLSKQGVHLYFLLFQGISFLMVGLDLIGEDVK